MKRFFFFLIVGVLVVQVAFSAGPRQESVTGLRIDAGLPNPQGALEELYIVSRVSGKGFVPSTLTKVSNRSPIVALTIFHFNDLHGHITDQHSKKGDTHRVSQMKKIVDEARCSAGGDDVVLFLSVGDEHTGTPFDELLGWNGQEFIMDPAYRILSAAGLDASVVGNHEVDRGYDLLARAVRSDAAFPVISANILSSRHLTPDVMPPAVIGVAKGLRIGIIGLTTPAETRMGTKEDPSARVGDPLEAVHYYLPKMEPFVDMFIFLNHLGYEGEERHQVPVGDRAIASAVAKLTSKPVMILGGHTHTILNKKSLEEAQVNSGIPIVQAGAYGEWLGRVSLSLRCSSGAFAAERVQAALLPIKARDMRVSQGQPGWESLEQEDDYDTAFESSYVRPILARLEEKMREPLARASSLPGLAGTQIIAERYVGECGMANFMNDMIISRSSSFPGGAVDIAVFNASGIAAGVESDPLVSFGDWFKVMPYADNIVIAELTGQQLLELVESNARRIVRPEELSGSSPVSLEGFISRGFLHFSSNLRYEILLGNGAAEARAENIRVNGVALRDALNTRYRVAFSTYIANGFEGWKTGIVGAGLPPTVMGWNLAALEKLDTGLVYRNEIIAGIKERGLIAPLDGSSAYLDGRVWVRK